MTDTINLDKILTPANCDAITANIVRRMADREAWLQELTPKMRREIEAAIARDSLRKRARTPWSTEKIRVLTAGDTRVTIYPGDHGGWILEAEGMTLTPTGWTDADAPHYFPTQAAAVEALAATL